jgi:hypothetical protein
MENSVARVYECLLAFPTLIISSFFVFPKIGTYCFSIMIDIWSVLKSQFH